jgi:hypothetical protein
MALPASLKVLAKTRWGSLVQGPCGRIDSSPMNPANSQNVLAVGDLCVVTSSARLNRQHCLASLRDSIGREREMRFSDGQPFA